MKTLKLAIIFLALVFSTSCTQEQKTDDTEALKKLLADYFDGIKHRDVAKMDSVTTNDFILFEDGRVWSNDSLVNMLNAFKSFDGTWTLTDMKINTDERSADAVYFNHGELIVNDTGKLNFDWVESATFRKVDGNWKMNFLHSTVRK
ncbi:MAG TPA: nuclear transport factor 2 family protein [Chryseosolibacter sp.]